MAGALVAEYGGSVAANGTQYVMSDQQGSPRVTMRVAAVNGQLVVARQDYLPFGEEVPGTVGPRAGVAGYDQQTGPRPRYAGMERDDSTQLSHTLWREFDSLSARWTAADPYGGSMSLADPQTFNRYSYVSNDPANQVDPQGLKSKSCGGNNGTPCTQADDYDQTKTIEGETKASFIVGMQAAGAKRYENYLNPPGQTAYEKRLAAMFGGEDAIMRTRFDYNGIYRGLNPDARARAAAWVEENGRPVDNDPVWDSEHLFNSPHLSGNLAGTENTDIIVPGNYQGQPTPPSPTASVVLIYYPVLGNRKNVTLAIFHVAHFNPRRVGGGRVRIGTTGGKGGNESAYRPNSPNRHSHFEIWSGRHAAVLPDGPKRDAVRIPFSLVFN